MNILVKKRASADKTKIWYSFEWGRNANQRRATGIYTYQHPKDQIQKNHYKEAKTILETKRSQMILDLQSINNGYIPQRKIKANFFRSEERRVGKECRYRWWPEYEKKKRNR